MMMANADDLEARARATKAVVDFESHTSAELVIAVRRRSGDYRAADFLVGFFASCVTLVVMLYVKHRFRLFMFPVDAALAFGAFAVLSSVTPPLRRLLTSRRARSDNARRAALATFVELGVHRCSGRWGILVYISMFEREVVVVPDVGIDLRALGDGWTKAVAALQAPLVAGGKVEAVFDAIPALGSVVAMAYPRRADDINELPDEPDVESAADAR